jgi:hypothetical protein
MDNEGASETTFASPAFVKTVETVKCWPRLMLACIVNGPAESVAGVCTTQVADARADTAALLFASLPVRVTVHDPLVGEAARTAQITWTWAPPASEAGTSGASSIDKPASQTAAAAAWTSAA